MPLDPEIAPEWFADPQEISENGERVSHLQPDAVYYAHLSIYDFARRYCQGGLVLDAGSGAGYGAAFLAAHGARQVWGIDFSARAVAFSQHHFQQPRLSYQEMSIEDITGFPEHAFDLVFSSNALEHVPRAGAFIRHAWRLLKPSGVLLLAVPPITDDRLLYLNLINPYHLNLWTPRQWVHALGSFFAEVKPCLHGVEQIGADFKPEHFAPEARLTERDFIFAPCTVDEMYQKFTLTAIFVASQPRPAAETPKENEDNHFIDESFTRPAGFIVPEIRERLRYYFELAEPPYVLPSPPSVKVTTAQRALKWVQAFVRKIISNLLIAVLGIIRL